MTDPFPESDSETGHETRGRHTVLPSYHVDGSVHPNFVHLIFSTVGSDGFYPGCGQWDGETPHCP